MLFRTVGLLTAVYSMHGTRICEKSLLSICVAHWYIKVLSLRRCSLLFSLRILSRILSRCKNTSSDFFLIYIYLI